MPHCQSLISILRQRGNRITPQREIIIEAIAHSDKHVTADEVYALVHARSRSINIATIYRTFDFLVEQGLASRIQLSDGRIVYATSNHGPHLHLLCRGCGGTFDADHHLVGSIGEQLQQLYGFTADLTHATFTGLCQSCQVEL